jgi:hypothetical protein
MLRVPHLRDGFIVAKVGIARSATVFFSLFKICHLDRSETQ